MDRPLPVTVPEQRPGWPGEATQPLSVLPDDDTEVSRLRSELAIDAAGIGSFDWDLVTGRLTWDEQLLALFGYRDDEFDQTIDAFAARLHPDDRDRTLQALQEAVDTRGAYEAEFRVVLPSGDTRWVQGRGRALADSRERVVRLLGAAIDTTNLRAGDARVSRVLETMRSAFFALDREWRFTYVNAEAERVLGRGREELLGGVVWELFPRAAGSEIEDNYRAAMATGEERVFDTHRAAPVDAWYEVRAWPGPDGLSVYVLDITERRAAEERAQVSAARLTLIAEVSALMSTALGSAAAEQAALQRVAEAVVPVLGDWSIVTLADGEDGRFQDVASWHADPAMRPAAATYAGLRLTSVAPDAPVLRSLESGRLVTVADVPAVVRPMLPGDEVLEAFDSLAPRTAVTLPLLARGRTLGALSVYRGHDRPSATPEDVAAAREVADRVALALDNARLFDQQRRLAEALQRSMLTAPPQPDDAEIVVRYQPAVQVAQVGGDWYDAFLQPDGSTVLVIGDVVGHDIEAAAAMGQLRGMLRGVAHRGHTPPDAVLTELDAAMGALGLHTMATAVVARVEQTPEQRAAGTTTLRWSNAGHPLPLLLTPDGEVRALGGDRGQLMLGVDPAAHRTSEAVEVRRGSTMLLYTDGLVEGRDLLLDEGVDLLRAALTELADLPLERLCDALVTRLRPEGLQDDVALVAIRLHPQP